MDLKDSLLRLKGFNPEKLLARIFSPGSLYLEDLETLLDEVKSVGMDPDGLERSFRAYVLIDAAPEEEKQRIKDIFPVIDQVIYPVASISSSDPKKAIFCYLAELQRIRHREGHSSGYVLSNESVHQAYIGALEKEIILLREMIVDLKKDIKELGDGDINTKDMLEFRRVYQETGFDQGEGLSWKEILAEQLDFSKENIECLRRYQEQLIDDLEEGRFKFRIPLVRL